MSHRLSRRSFPQTLTLLALLLGCESSPTGTPPDDPGGGGGGGNHPTLEVRANLFRFVEQVIEIPMQGKVRWIANDGLPHTVTPTGHDAIERGFSDQAGAIMLEQVFTVPGTYHYHCEYHGELGMVGTVVVY